MPPAVASEMVPLNLKMVSDFKDKMVQDTQSSANVNIKVLRNPSASQSTSGGSSKVTTTTLTARSVAGENEVNVTRPPIPHASSILSKASCVANHQKQKPPSWNKEDNLKILASIASNQCEEQNHVPSQGFLEEEGPEDFFPPEASRNQQRNQSHSCTTYFGHRRKSL